MFRFVSLIGGSFHNVYVDENITLHTLNICSVFCQSYFSKAWKQEACVWKAAWKGSGNKAASADRSVPLFLGRLHGGLGQAPPHSDPGLQGEH